MKVNICKLLLPAILSTFVSCEGCKLNTGFEALGVYSVKKDKNSTTIVTDGFGRKICLYPKGGSPDKSFKKTRTIEVPIKRVVAYLDCDISLMRALDALNQTLVGVTKKKEEWTAKDIIEAMDRGQIVYLGQATKIDYELLKQSAPDVVFTWDESAIPMLDQLDISTVITTTNVARGFETYLVFIKFLSHFFNKEKMASDYVTRVSAELERIKKKTAGVKHRPSVIWGDIYQKRVLVEPINSWPAELINLSGGTYALSDVYGADCLEITLEKFYSTGQTTDIMFTYRSPKQGIDTRQEIINENPLMTQIKPFVDGAIYSPYPHYYESADRLDEIIKEIAAILHPELFKGYKLKYFMKLP